MSFTARHWIDGEPAGSPTMDNIDPATGERIGRFADGGLPETGAAVACARRAFDRSDWAADRPKDRRGEGAGDEDLRPARRRRSHFVGLLQDAWDDRCALLHPVHVGDRDRRYVEPADPRGRRRAEGATTARPNGARDAAAYGPSANHDPAVRDGRHRCPARARLLLPTGLARRHDRPHARLHA